MDSFISEQEKEFKSIVLLCKGKPLTMAINAYLNYLYKLQSHMNSSPYSEYEIGQTVIINENMNETLSKLGPAFIEGMKLYLKMTNNSEEIENLNIDGKKNGKEVKIELLVELRHKEMQKTAVVAANIILGNTSDEIFSEIIIDYMNIEQLKDFANQLFMNEMLNKYNGQIITSINTYWDYQ